LLQAAVSVGQATVADDTQLLQTANSEASMNAAWKKAQMEQKQASTQASFNSIFGGPNLSTTMPPENFIQSMSSFKNQ